MTPQQVILRQIPGVINSMRKSLLIIFFVFSSASLFCSNAKGPLLGKNYYIPFLPFYSFPGVSAAPGEKNDISFSVAQYFIQDIVAEFHLRGDDLIRERFVDYEGYILEATLSYNFLDSLEVGLTSRLHAYYGGYGDDIIEFFHGILDCPNGGREYYPQNEVYINIQTDTGIHLNLTEPLVGIGDLDLFMKWNFLSIDYINMAAFSAVKFPIGSMENITGSGYMDFGASLLIDFHPLYWLSVYIQNGFILPGQLFNKEIVSPDPIYSLLFALEFIPFPRFSVVAQFRLNTSPIAEDSVIPDNLSYSVKLNPPMTNILLGIVFTAADYRFQFSLEEDAFTNNGADLILNFTVGKSFHI